MTITAKYTGKCSKCGGHIHAGERIEWSTGQPTRHVSCPATSSSRGGYARVCKTGGNCSSFGSGRSCGAADCDGY